MTAIVKRNLKIFFRDKTTVFFSLLGAIIIIGLYVLFLGDMIIKDLEHIKNARFLMDSWIMAGLLAVTSITTTMGAFGIMVDDKSKKTLKDFSASPLKRSSLAGGYIFSSYIIGVIITMIAFIFAELYIVSGKGHILSFLPIIKVMATILLSVLSGTAMVFFIVSFFKSQNAFATASTILGTLIGFLTGIYIPIGSLPNTVQFIIKIFPVSHSGVLFRQIMMEAPIKEAFPNAEARNSFAKELGMLFTFGNHTVTWVESVLVLTATAVTFYILATINMSRKNK